MATKTPQKYQAESRRYEDKSWLYQQYWGQLKSTVEIASVVDITDQTLRHKMERFGIPRRHPHWETYSDPCYGFRPVDDSEPYETEHGSVVHEAMIEGE